jgi:hypothetical protein
MITASIDPKYSLALLQAAKKGLDAKTARDETKPGVYRNIKMTVEIEVDEMRVAPDTDKAPTASIPLLPTLALLLKRMGVQREEGLDIIKEVMTEALDMGKDATSALLADSGVEAMQKRLKTEVIDKLPRTPVKGAVKVEKEAVSVVVRSMTMDVN